jgi:hypothetical protein
MEIRSEDSQAPEDDDGHDEEDDRREQDAACERTH